MGSFNSKENEVASKFKTKSAGGAEGNLSDSGKSNEDKQSSDLKDKTCSPGNDRKKPKPCPKKKKFIEEPAEILILSSDEEEEVKPKKTELPRLVPSSLAIEPDYKVFGKISTEDMAKAVAETKLNMNNNVMENLQPGQYTTFLCRSVRIGSYKVVPKDRVLISNEGVKVIVPPFNSSKNEAVTIKIPFESIYKILVNYGETPVIFIYPHPKIAIIIRELLSMTSTSGPYYDPTSRDNESHKRFTILLEKVTEDNKIAVQNIFANSDKLQEIDNQPANEILVVSSPIENSNVITSRPVTESVQKVLVYPPPPEKGGITINNQDYACLGEDQFLNDVIIDFYLKYLMYETLSAEDRNRTHVFSTFFYKRLTTKPKTMRKNDPENDPKLSPAEKRHMRVKGWTKKVKLFEKDFIIVPINEHSHWFLAIICFPGLTGPVRFSDNTPIEVEEPPTPPPPPKKSTQSVQIGNTTITHIVKSENSTINLEMDSGSDRDEAEGDQDDLHPSSDDEESEQAEEESAIAPSQVQIPLLAPPPPPKEVKTKPVRRKAFKEPIKQPCILIFDSLAGASRVRVVATLRDYLKVEYKAQFGKDRDFSKDTVKGAVPKVPQQNNFTDCGLYVLQYVEAFFKNPLHDFNLPLKYLQEWFSEEIVSRKRMELAILIRMLMEKQRVNVDMLPTLVFSNGAHVGDPNQYEEDDEEHDEEEDVDEDDEMNEYDEEEMIKKQYRDLADFENDEEEDMDLGEEEEEEYEEGQILTTTVARVVTQPVYANNANMNSSFQQGHGGIIKRVSLVSYADSDSNDGENHVMQNSGDGKPSEELEEGEYVSEGATDHLIFTPSDRKKNVPLTELQDFESQIRCTTIERNVEGRNSESDMQISEGDEEASDLEVRNTPNRNQIVKTSVVPNVEKKPMETAKELISRLAREKGITIHRKEDSSNSNTLKRQLGINQLKNKNCDKGEENKTLCTINSPKINAVSPVLNANANVASVNANTANVNPTTYKRPSDSLKSVRIQKKTDRNEFMNKRQKIDER